MQAHFIPYQLLAYFVYMATMKHHTEYSLVYFSTKSAIDMYITIIILCYTRYNVVYSTKDVKYTQPK